MPPGDLAYAERDAAIVDRFLTARGSGRTRHMVSASDDSKAAAVRAAAQVLQDCAPSASPNAGIWEYHAAYESVRSDPRHT